MQDPKPLTNPLSPPNISGDLRAVHYYSWITGICLLLPPSYQVSLTSPPHPAVVKPLMYLFSQITHLVGCSLPGAFEAADHFVTMIQHDSGPNEARNKSPVLFRFGKHAPFFSETSQVPKPYYDSAYLWSSCASLSIIPEHLALGCPAPTYCLSLTESRLHRKYSVNKYGV